MKRSTKIRIRGRGASRAFLPAALPLSAQTLTYAAGVIRGHRKKIGSAWRKLNPGRQALLVLAYLRKGPRDRRMKTLTARQKPELGWRHNIKGFRRPRAE